MCRSSAEHRLKIEGLGAQTQTILLACRERLGGSCGVCVLCECVCVRDGARDRDTRVCVPLYLCPCSCRPASVCSGRIWSGLVWSGLIWMDLGPGLHCSCTTAGLQPLLHRVHHLRVLRGELGGPGQHHLQSRLAIGLGESGLCGGDPAKKGPDSPETPTINDRRTPSTEFGGCRGGKNNYEDGKEEPGGTGSDCCQTCTWSCEACLAAGAEPATAAVGAVQGFQPEPAPTRHTSATKNPSCAVSRTSDKKTAYPPPNPTPNRDCLRHALSLMHARPGRAHTQLVLAQRLSSR